MIAAAVSMGAHRGQPRLTDDNRMMERSDADCRLPPGWMLGWCPRHFPTEYALHEARHRNDRTYRNGRQTRRA